MNPNAATQATFFVITSVFCCLAQAAPPGPSNAANPVPPLPVPRHDTLHDYQSVCSAENGFKTFSSSVACVKALANESTDHEINRNDPQTQLYLLTADKLVVDVAARRATPAEARISLQRVLIEVESSKKAEAEVARTRWESEREARTEQAARVAAEDERRRQEQAHNDLLMQQAEAQRQAQAAQQAQQAADELQAQRDQARRALAVQLLVHGLTPPPPPPLVPVYRAPTTTNCQTSVVYNTANTNCTTY